ncbi:glycerol-3-phosphate responsive antiterminator [Sulfobacillus sp. DSM 109850]|uniref:Glycerol-3-phosphate responsive antiterminator n=1 Tax=Sulfobacillus harzensis TaxID=2729629 RepID=A0A7Y0L2U0_9FIRM|nr:glycerol-3-phosphate responsive antiterminator [Sulfobacillus harzensis]
MPTIIPAIRDPDEWTALPPPLSSPRWVFILGGTPDALAEATGLLHRQGWRVFVHVDMMRGITTDLEGLRFLTEFVDPDGIISTHSPAIIHAKRIGLVAIQRIFLLDSQSVDTGIQQAQSTRPDAVEVLPGILPRVTARVVREAHCPVIAGGLVTTIQEVEVMKRAGVRGLSTSAQSLWLDARSEGVKP